MGDLNEIERQYSDLNEVEKFVVDNYKKFEVGMALDLIHIDGCSNIMIGKKIRKVCNVVRMRINTYIEITLDLFEELYEACKIEQDRVKVYTLKPKNQIPDIYKIIEKRRKRGINNKEEKVPDEVSKKELRENEIEETQLERQYLDLNAVDRYVVDNYKRFLIGVSLDLIHIDGYKSNGIAKKLQSTCNVVRMRKKKYEDLFGWCGIEQDQVRVYTLKPKNQIPDLYAIIEYKNYQNKPEQSEDQSEKEVKNESEKSEGEE